mgnify:FL=1
MEQQLVVFSLDKEFYGLDIDSVEGIIKLQAITKMPNTPAYIEGVINLRGSVIPVIDLRKRFGLPTIETTPDTRIINVFLGSTKVGMIVDGVSEVIRIPDESVVPPPSMISSVDTAFIRAIAKVDERMITLLDLSQILNRDQQAIVEKIVEPK